MGRQEGTHLHTHTRRKIITIDERGRTADRKIRRRRRRRKRERSII
jgi:hypothetical protein